MPMGLAKLTVRVDMAFEGKGGGAIHKKGNI